MNTNWIINAWIRVFPHFVIIQLVGYVCISVDESHFSIFLCCFVFFLLSYPSLKEYVIDTK